MTDRELLQDALDALTYVGDAKDIYSGTIDALRARLAQPEQKPVAWGLQQQFEAGIGTTPVAFKRHDEFGFVVPLYTAPPQREWVGLTDEEVVVRANAEVFAEAFARGVAWAEAKLKEKNG